MEIKINEYTLTLSVEVLLILEQYTQHEWNAKESGGIILGKIVENNINIERLSIPTELDKGYRTYFERHRLSAQIIIDYEHINSYGQMVYLGEWHTHPEDHPTPSSIDIKMIKQQFKHNIIHTDFLILLIKGRENLFASLINSNGIIIA